MVVLTEERLVLQNLHHEPGVDKEEGKAARPVVGEFLRNVAEGILCVLRQLAVVMFLEEANLMQTFTEKRVTYFVT